MTKAIKFYTASLLALCLLTGFAYASDPYKGYKSTETAFSWTGLYIGAAGGFHITDNVLSLDDGAGTVLGVEGLSSRNWSAKAKAGFDWQVNRSLFVVGVWGEYAKGLNSNDDFAITMTGPGTILNANVEPHYAAGVRVGVATTPGTLVYVGYGYARGQLDISVPAMPGACAPAALQCSHDLDGRVIKLGIDHALSKTVIMGLEYGRTDWNSKNLLPSTMAPASLQVEPTSHEIMLTIRWKPDFNFNF